MPRRPVTALPGLAPSKASAMSASRPAASRSARVTASGAPGSSSSPVKIDRDVHAAQLAGAVQGPQRFQRHEVAALHVGGAGAVGAIALAPEGLALQHGVEMADQQQPRTVAATVRRDEMPAALHPGRQFDPACRESQRLQFARVDRADRAHAGQVLGRARHVHRFFEQADGCVELAVDLRNDLCFGGLQWRGAGRRRAAQRQQGAGHGRQHERRKRHGSHAAGTGSVAIGHGCDQRGRNGGTPMNRWCAQTTNTT